MVRPIDGHNTHIRSSALEPVQGDHLCWLVNSMHHMLHMVWMVGKENRRNRSETGGVMGPSIASHTQDCCCYVLRPATAVVCSFTCCAGNTRACLQASGWCGSGRRRLGLSLPRLWHRIALSPPGPM